MDLDSPTPATTDTTSDTSMARGPLMPSLLLMLMLMLTMVPTATATLLWLMPLLCPPSMDSPTPATTDTSMARGLLMLSPLLPLLLKLMPMPSTTTGMPTTATAMLLPTMDTMATPATTDIPTCTTATATSTENNLLILVC